MSNGVFVYREPALIVQDILQQGMGLKDGQVMFTNQKIFIPTPGPLIVVKYVGPSKIICSTDDWSDIGGVFTETQRVTMFHRLQIDILSYDDTARQMRDGITFAIHSLLSETMQELYNMQIARQPSPFMDTSFLEETKRITAYTTELSTISVNQKTQPVGDFYTDFSRSVPPQVVVNA